MPTVTSNLMEIRRTLFGLGQTLNLRRRVGRGRLGNLLVDATAEAIVYRSLGRQTDPLGRLWKRLSRRYLDWKLRHGYSPLRNVQTGAMMTVEQVRGHVTITSHLATMTGGLDEDVAQKIDWAEEGGKNRPARPFMDLGKEGEQAVDDVIESAIDAHLKSL